MTVPMVSQWAKFGEVVGQQNLRASDEVLNLKIEFITCCNGPQYSSMSADFDGAARIPGPV